MSQHLFRCSNCELPGFITLGDRSFCEQCYAEWRDRLIGFYDALNEARKVGAESKDEESAEK